MYSTYSNYNHNQELTDIISNAIKNKNKINKKHSDCLNCLINCAEYRFVLQVIHNNKKGKSNIFFIQEKENLSSPLFFYNISSNEIIERIENKNVSENYLNASQKIKSENEIDEKYEQNKKNKILLFSYIKFPLINIYSELNINKESTLIILDDGKHDIISNCSINSYSLAANNCCSLLFDIKSVNYLFSLDDIKDSSEIKIKFNGNIHEQQLIKKDAICTFSPDLIINSIKARMVKHINLNEEKTKNNIYDKYFFSQIYDKNRNNFGILFSFKKKKDSNIKIFDAESIMKENIIIIKIFFCVDMWINTNINDIHRTNDTSDSTSNCSKLKAERNDIYNEPERNYNKIGFNDNYDLNLSNNYNNLYNYEYYNKELVNYNNSNSIPLYDYSNKYENNKYDENTYYNYPSPQSYNYYNNNDEAKNTLENSINNEKAKYLLENAIYNEEVKYQLDNASYDKENYFNNLDYYNSNLENEQSKEEVSPKEICDYYELNTLLKSIEPQKKDKSLKILPNKNINLNKSIYIDLNNKLMNEIFSKYKEDNCLSNYLMAKKRIDINMNIEREKLKKIKIKYFFDCFKNINNLTSIIPYINEKGKLLFTEISPSLSSMRLVLKTQKNIIKKLKKQKSNFHIKKAKEDIIIIEYDKNIIQSERDLLYIQMNEIIKVIGDNKLLFKNILYDKSYFCILWSFTNSQLVHSSFLAYYSFDLKLIGIFIINVNTPQWFSSFSFNYDYFKDFKKEYNKNEEELKKYLYNLSLDKGDGQYQHFYTYDYMRYTQSCKNSK